MAWVDPSTAGIAWTFLLAFHQENPNGVRNEEDQYYVSTVNYYTNSGLRWTTGTISSSPTTPAKSVLANPLVGVPFVSYPPDYNLTIDYGDTSSRPAAAPILYPRPT